jgi:tripartite-type tricarboxylate transporter receptor subunit TctC
MLNKRFFLHGALSVAFTICTPFICFAQTEMPKGPVTLIVPFPAGGATDVVSRLIAKRLGDRIGKPVVVENVGGAGGVIGAQKATRSAKDGSVLLMGTVSTHVINPLSLSPAPYDPLKDFTPISLIVTVPNVILVHPSVKAQNVKELIELAKSQPGKINYGSSGIGTPMHLSGELFRSMSGTDMQHVPYRGGGPAMADLISGHIPVLFDVLTGAASHVRNGGARPIAVTTAVRSPSFPNIPTVAESGLKGYETYTWNAIFAPAGVSSQIAAQYSKEFQSIVAEPEVQEKLKELSASPVGSTPEELSNHLKAELSKWGPVIKSLGGLKLN